MFISADALNNMNLLKGKQLPDGREEFSKTKQWAKSMKDIEAEQKYKQEIISEIQKLEKKIDLVLQKLESETAVFNSTVASNNSAAASSSTWKEKLKSMVK